MTEYLHDATYRVLERLGDLAEEVWTAAEIKLYIKDGYDRYCRDTKCLFDILTIRNQPVVGNWQSDLERWFASQKPDWTVTDDRMGITGAYLKDYGFDSAVGQYAGFWGHNPTPGTKVTERTYFDADNFNSISSDLPTTVAGGNMPQLVTEVLRVYFDKRTLKGESSQRMRELDPNYETTEGDPKWYLLDKDGMHFLRVVPVAGGDATYETQNWLQLDGTPHNGWGHITQRLDSDSAVEDTIDQGSRDGWGIEVHRDDLRFPAMGAWGIITEIHPLSTNIVYEVHRLGRDLDCHPFELPLAYIKYIEYYACGQALERVGPGQSIKLAEHYYDRFQMGVDRMIKKKRDLLKERIGRFGGGDVGETNFGLGDPQTPGPYSWNMTSPY